MTVQKPRGVHRFTNFLFIDQFRKQEVFFGLAKINLAQGGKRLYVQNRFGVVPKYFRNGPKTTFNY